MIVDAKALGRGPGDRGRPTQQAGCRHRPRSRDPDRDPGRQRHVFAQERTERLGTTAPRQEKADTASVMAFLSRIDSLQTSEFFTANQITKAGLDTPVMTVKIWERKRARPREPAACGRDWH